MLSLRKTLAKFNSPVNGRIEVVQEGQERRLVVGGLVQSINADAPDVEERIWGQLVDIKRQKAKIKNALILGLGGGTVAHLLTQKFGPIPIDAVEIDPLIVEIGKKFFGLDKLPNLNIIVGDAIDAIRNPTDHSLLTTYYSLIIVDLYCGSKYPSEAESPSFFAALKRLTHPKGVIVFNRISGKRYSEFEEKLKEHFTDFQKKTVPSKFGGKNMIYSVRPALTRAFFFSPTSCKPKAGE